MFPQSAFELLQKNKGMGYLSFGCDVLDSTIGGIPLQGITEISGEAGSGKTQLCLTLSIRSQLPLSQGGLDGAVAYLSCGEGEFPLRRLQQIASEYASKSNMDPEEYLNNVNINQCHSSDDLEESLNKIIPKICASSKLRLIIIDSLAGVIRSEYDTSNSTDMRDRTMLLFRIATKLKWLSDTFNLCIVVINQVSANFTNDNNNINSNSNSSSRRRSNGFHSNPNEYDDDGNNAMNNMGGGSINSNVHLNVMKLLRHCKPALGLVWSHCVNT
eukprot:gene11478-24003_t